MSSRLLTQARALNVPIVETHAATDVTDAMVVLGGAYDGIHLQVGSGYYQVVRELPGPRFRFIEGNGDLKGELTEALK